MLIGDIGGFNGAILLFLTSVMRFYSSAMLQAQLIQDVPVRKPKRSRLHHYSHEMNRVLGDVQI